MENIDILEGGAPLAVRHRGEILNLGDPRAMHFQQVLMALDSEIAPGTPSLPGWQAALVFERWCAAWDLPSLNESLYLAHLVDRYRREATYDLRVTAGVDLGELWRARRWRLLLDLLDNLPAHTTFQAATINDDERAARAAKEIVAARRQKREETGQEETHRPSLVGYTQEVSMLAKILDSVNALTHTTILANTDKPVAPPKPEPRPESALERAIRIEEHRVREAAHRALADRVLRRKG